MSHQGGSPSQQHRPLQQQSHAPSQASQSNYLTADHAAAIQTTLQLIDSKMAGCASKIDHSLQTAYPPTEARADYHAMLALLQTLEQQSQPIASIGYDDAVLSNFLTHPPPGNPLEACGRLVTDLGGMNAKLKTDAMHLQGALQQQGAQAKSAAKEFKSGMARMMQGAVAPVSQAEAAQQMQNQLPTQALTPQAMHAAQLAYAQNQQRQAMR